MPESCFNPESFVSDRAAAIKPSGIRKFFDILDEMKGVVSLTVGQPDFVTPWHVREAGIRSLEDGKTYYTSNSGLLELRTEIAAYQKRRFSLEYDPKSEIIVTVGGSEAIDIALRAVLNPGDEVVIPEPSFVCYSPLVELAGGVAVRLPLREEDGFKLTPELLSGVISNKTKALILPFPNNPTGAVMDRDELEEIAKVIRKTNSFIISDELYAELTYNSSHCSIATLEGMRERTVVINGFSKAYAMTGWRLGYCLAPKAVTKQMLKIHQYCIMCAPITSQYAAITAIRDGDEDIEFMKMHYDSRRRFILKRFKEMEIECFAPGGAFYVFPNISRFGLSSEQFCERLLKEANTAIVPGNAFGECGEGFARISYAYSLSHIEKALNNIEGFIKKLKAER
ncbi:MAG: aminotransferase class I/II-fold pyridoxal phosphate-dependent enzyme [Eubacteriales bacterium]|nr:aminotransferase class I/II-fold pyridoxal phosphate-dependent enzyme [Eubacteriales bacterium]MDD4475396.1 aminotransferase class I/II-fold pyridoxal phosphate-dependent enzyme [Eubacteriales bacterium]